MIMIMIAERESETIILIDSAMGEVFRVDVYDLPEQVFNGREYWRMMIGGTVSYCRGFEVAVVFDCVLAQTPK